ncbi:MAG: FAD-binding protein, partial [Clostridia bacterium]|nr:FAD-binding protein [Clostridia bacterium]
MQKALAPILAQFSDSKCEFFPSYPLAQLTTFRIGGAAEMLAAPKSEEALLRLLSLLADAGIPRVVIGNGSNLLASDAGYRGVVIRTGGLHQIRRSAHTITAECGAALSAVAAMANRHGIGGFPSLAGIPGTLGGAIFMNAGAGDTAIGDRVLSVRAVPACGGVPITLGHDECHFGYRKSIFMSRGLLVLSAEITGEPEAPELLLSRTAEAIAARRSKQPL